MINDSRIAAEHEKWRIGGGVETLHKGPLRC